MSRRGENIYKRKDGRYEGRYIKTYDCEGKAKYGAVYARTYAETKEKLYLAKEALILRQNYKESAQTVNQWFSGYLEKIKNTIKESTYFIYLRYIRNHIEPYLGKRKLADLQPEHLQGFINHLSEQGLSARTIKIIYIFVSEGLKEAQEQKYIDTVWKKVRLPKVTAPKMRVFTANEQKRLEAAADENEAEKGIGIFLCLYTGLRLGELCGLKWKDINFYTKTLTVRRTLQRVPCQEPSEEKTKLVFLPPKSVSSIREIPLPGFMMRKLWNYKQSQFNMSKYVIHNNGKVIEPRNYQYYFKRLLKQAKIEPANFHTLRHTFATRALEIGFDVKTLSELLGHSSATITLNKYAHSLDEHKRSRMEMLSAIYQ